MILRKNVDLGAAFETLKAGLELAENFKNNQGQPSISVRYAEAYGCLTAYVKHTLKEVEEPNDIPAALFTGGGTGESEIYGTPIGEDGILSAPTLVLNQLHNH